MRQIPNPIFLLFLSPAPAPPAVPTSYSKASTIPAGGSIRIPSIDFDMTKTYFRPIPNPESWSKHRTIREGQSIMQETLAKEAAEAIAAAHAQEEQDDMAADLKLQMPTVTLEDSARSHLFRHASEITK